VRVLAACGPGEVRAVAWDGSLVDVAIWRPESPDGVGDLHRGVVGKVVPAMAGAFVRIGGGEGFLPDSAGWRGLSEGARVVVRVVRAAQGGKGPRLARQDGDAGGGDPALLARGEDGVTRLARLHPGGEVVVDDPAVAAMLRPGLGDRLRIGPAFDEDVAAAFAGVLEPVAALPGGARMTVTPTPALTAIDIDLGAGTAGRGAKGRSQAAANLGLVPALARQIRLRNLAGAILVDFAGMPAARRKLLAPALAEALAGDPLRPRLVGFTELGLAEILRPRVHPPLAELMTGPLAAGLAALRAAAAAVAARPERPLVLRATPAIIAALREDGAGLADFARRAGRPIELAEVRAAPLPPWTVEDRHG
jgi:Ribonuclease G/E